MSNEQQFIDESIAALVAEGATEEEARAIVREIVAEVIEEVER